MKYIKLFEQEYSIYDIITMTPGMAGEVLIDEIKKTSPDIELIKNLLDHSLADVNLRTDYESTALMWAVGRDHVNIVKLLLEHPHIDVNIKERNGSTALIMATVIVHKDIVKLLLDHPEIDVNVQTERGYTALMRSCINKDKDIIEMLLLHPNIDICISRKEGRYLETAYSLASNELRDRFPNLKCDV